MTDASNTVQKTKSETPKTALDQWVTWMRSSYFGVAFVTVCACIADIRPFVYLVLPPVFVMALWGVGQVAKKMYGDKLDRALDELHMKTQKITVDGFLKYFDHVQKHRLYIASASLIAFLLCVLLRSGSQTAYGISLAVCVLGACVSSFLIHYREIFRPDPMRPHFTWGYDVDAHKRMLRDSDPFSIGTSAYSSRQYYYQSLRKI